MTSLQAVRRATLAFVGITLGTALAAPQLLPSYELLQSESVRRIISSPGFSLHMSLAPVGIWHFFTEWHLLSYLVPNNVGLGPLGASALFASLLFTRNYRLAIFAVMPAFALLYAFGEFTPVGVWFSELNLPVLSKLRRPSFILTPFNFFLTLAMAQGLNRWASLASAERPLRWPEIGGFLVPILFAVWPIRYTLFPPKDAALGYNLASPLTAGLVAVAVLIYAVAVFGCRRLVPALAGTLLVVAVGIESFALSRTWLAYDSKASYERDPDFQALRLTLEGIDRIAVFNHKHLHNAVKPLGQGEGMMLQKRFLSGYSAAALFRYNRVIKGAVTKHPRARSAGMYNLWMHKEDWLHPDNFFLLDLLNVRYVVAKNTPLKYVEAFAARGVRFKHSTFGALQIYENLQAAPPAYLVRNAIPYDDFDTGLSILLENKAVHTRRLVLVERDVAEKYAQKESDADSDDYVAITEYTLNEVRLSVKASAPGYLVLTDSFYPGWKVQIDDGEWQDAFPVNLLCRGAFLDAGTHTVRFTFRPAPFYWGLWISGSALGLLFLSGSVCFMVRFHRLKRTE